MPKADGVTPGVAGEVAALPEHMRQTPEALLCLALARQMDAATTPRDAATVSKELRAALAALREAIARAGKRGDVVDEIGARRAARRSTAAEAASST